MQTDDTVTTTDNTSTRRPSQTGAERQRGRRNGLTAEQRDIERLQRRDRE